MKLCDEKLMLHLLLVFEGQKFLLQLPLATRAIHRRARIHAKIHGDGSGGDSHRQS